MNIIITIQKNDTCLDLRVDNRQTLADIIKLLQKSNLYFGSCADFYKSQCREKLVSVYRTLEEQEIYSGDHLIAVE